MPPTRPPFPPAPVRSLAPLLASLPCAAALGAPWTVARAAPFDELGPEAREAVTSACLPVQYRDGAAAYRACLEREAEARSAREPGALELLGLDERYAVERRCAGERDASEVAWFDCVDAEIASLATAPPLELGGLREDERHALLRECFDDQSNAGAAGWRTCMSEAAERLADVPRADLSALGAVERNALVAGCADRDDAAGYRRCLLERGAPAGATARAPGASSDASDEASGEVPAPSPGTGREAAVDRTVSPPAEGLTLGRPAPEALAGASPEPSPGPAAEPALAPPPSLGAAGPDDAVPARPGTSARPVALEEPSVAGAGPSVGDAGADALEGSAEGAGPGDASDAGGAPDGPGVVARMGDAYGSLEPGGRLLLWSALALPLLLLASSALLRRRASTSRAGRDGGASLADRIGPTRGRPDAAPRGAFEADALDGPDPLGPDDRRGGHTSRVRNRLHDEADDLFDALDRDLDAGDDPDDDFADDSRAFGPNEEADFDEPSRDVRLHDDESPAPDAFAAREGGGPDVVAEDPEPDGPGEARAPEAVDEISAGHGSEPRREPRTAPPDARDAEGLADMADLDREAPTRLVAPPVRPAPIDRDGTQRLDGTGDIELAVARDAPDEAPPPAAGGREGEGGEFGAWLASRPDERRRDLALEFLVYWMAWGDERYDPATRDAVFADDAPDDVTLVKRRVLEEDVGAFADTVRWFVLNASREARSEVLELLVALLVTDPVPTPVQNTLLRFLADVFGLGAPVLEAQFERAFDAPLPPLPRVDRPDWWARQDEAGMVRREGRVLAAEPAEVRHRARLGLPLAGALEVDEVLGAFELAARRSAPERFDALGERGRTLAARQLDRFVDARDALLEESR